MKKTIAIFFGGRSTEHEVSVITGIQAFENLDKEKYDAIPIYVSKEGEFYTNEKFWDLKNYKNLNNLLLSSKKVVFTKGGFYNLGLINKFTKLDVAFPLTHGSFGEDGSLQGMLDFYQIPFIGFSTLGSAIGMDKLTSKYVFQSLGIPIGKFISIKRSDFNEDSKKALSVAKNLKYPLIVKPGDIGSSIGVNKVETEKDLEFDVEIAFSYSDCCLVEEAFTNIIEVNCAAVGYLNPTASLCEQPVVKEATLSFKDKYQSGEGKSSKHSGMASLYRKIPAPISKELTKKIQDTTVKVFKALEGCGVARIDYFVDPKTEKFWINEINTIPGSLSFYLYEPMGISYKEELEIMIESALERAKDQSKTQYTFESGLLESMAKAGGLKH